MAALRPDCRCQPTPKERNNDLFLTGIIALALVVILILGLMAFFVLMTRQPASQPISQPTPVLVPTATPVPWPALVLTNANVRAGSSVGYPVVRTVPSGSVVEVTGCNEDCSWYRVQGGWICADLIRVIVGSVGQ